MGCKGEGNRKEAGFGMVEAMIVGVLSIALGMLVVDKARQHIRARAQKGGLDSLRAILEPVERAALSPWRLISSLEHPANAGFKACVLNPSCVRDATPPQRIVFLSDALEGAGPAAGAPVVLGGNGAITARYTSTGLLCKTGVTDPECANPPLQLLTGYVATAAGIQLRYCLTLTSNAVKLKNGLERFAVRDTAVAGPGCQSLVANAAATPILRPLATHTSVETALIPRNRLLQCANGQYLRINSATGALSCELLPETGGGCGPGQVLQGYDVATGKRKCSAAPDATATLSDNCETKFGPNYALAGFNPDLTPICRPLFTAESPPCLQGTLSKGLKGHMQPVCVYPVPNDPTNEASKNVESTCSKKEKDNHVPTIIDLDFTCPPYPSGEPRAAISCSGYVTSCDDEECNYNGAWKVNATTCRARVRARCHLINSGSRLYVQANCF